MPTRRQFLSYLAAVPVVGWLVPRVAETPIAPGERRKYRRISRESPADMVDAIMRLNSTPWRGNAVHSVQFRCWSWWRLPDGSWDLTTEVIGLSRHEWPGVTDPVRLVGETDFNRFDFGEPV